VGVRYKDALGYIDFPRDVTAQTRENAYAAYNQLAVQRVQAIGFNFSATDYLNSAGIGLIISLVEDANAAGRKVFAYGLNSHNRKLFRMVGLTERLTLVADEAEMQAKLAPPAEPQAAPAPMAEQKTPSEAVAEPAPAQAEPQAAPAPVAEQKPPTEAVIEPAPAPSEARAEPSAQVVPPAEQANPKAEA
jgi:anti-anti-sigma regulatory factor